MYTKRIDNPFFTLQLLLKRPENDIISFEDCIELKTNLKSFPQIPLFRIVDKKMYSKVKLSKYNNVVKVMLFSFKKNTTKNFISKFLKENLPTLFDYKTITKKNWEFCVYQFRDHILQSSICILGEEEVKAMNLHLNLGCTENLEALESEETIIDDIIEFSEEIINF